MAEGRVALSLFAASAAVGAAVSLGAIYALSRESRGAEKALSEPGDVAGLDGPDVAPEQPVVFVAGHAAYVSADTMETPVADQALEKLDLAETGSGSASRVLVLYTGGTIGSHKTADGYVPTVGFLPGLIRSLPIFHDPEMEEFTTPLSKYGRRVKYDVLEYEELLDSANMSMSDWVAIANVIADNYDKYDGFVILHGTDTLAYTASALAFILENLGKTVVVTGSQMPIMETRTDARENFMNSLMIAGHYRIPEVCVYFNNQLMRGCRVIKQDSEGLEAFGSPNLPPLGTVGISVNIDWSRIYRPALNLPFQVEQNLSQNVGSVRLFPGIPVGFLKHIFEAPTEGIILETFGAGNAPSHRAEMLEAIAQAIQRGIVVVNITQCPRGSVDMLYETGTVLAKIGVIPGGDLTSEAALAKLSYLLGKRNAGLITHSEVITMMGESLRGELTIKNNDDDTTSQAAVRILVDAIRQLSMRSSPRQVGDDPEDMCTTIINDYLFPTLGCAAAASADTQLINELVRLGADPSVGDYDARTPLHLAAATGNLEVVRALVEQHRVAVDAIDRWGSTPMQSALEAEFLDVARLLRSYGAAPLARRGCESIHKAIENHDINLATMLLRFHDTKSELLYETDNPHGWTFLHRAAFVGCAAIVPVVIRAGSSLKAIARDGNTALELAVLRRQSGVVQVLTQITKTAPFSLPLSSAMACALLGALHADDTPLVQAMMDAGYDVVSYRFPGGSTIMHVAALHGAAGVAGAVLDALRQRMLQTSDHEDAVSDAGVLGWEDDAGRTPMQLFDVADAEVDVMGTRRVLDAHLAIMSMRSESGLLREDSTPLDANE